MIPIKNKKKSLEVTVDEMRNFSFNYIGRDLFNDIFHNALQEPIESNK